MTVQKHILQITSYPPPRNGWGVRAEFLKRYLERQGHRCAVLNLGPNRRVPSTEYETVLGGWDYIRKVWRFSRQGFVAHVHANGASPKGVALAILAQLLNRAAGQRSVLTFHAGTDQLYFPRHKAPAHVPLFRLLFALSRAVICNSEEVKAKIVEYGVPPAKIFPIPAFSRQYLEATDDALPAELEAFYGRFQDVVFCYTKIRRLFYPEALLDGFAQLAAERAQAGLVLCGIAGFMEPDIWDAVRARLDREDLRDRVIVVDDLPHEAFLLALSRASLYLRTHVSDGVCSSVMEALALGVPVVASENGTRPPGVRTYPADDAGALAAAMGDVLDRRQEIAAALPRPDVRDTLEQEALVLTS